MKRKTAAFLMSVMLYTTGIGISQIPTKKQQQSRTAEKMKSVPKLPADRSLKSAPTLGDPTMGVIPQAVVQKDESGTVRRVEGQIAVQGASDARTVAEKFLKQNGDKLGISPLVNSRDTETGLRVVNEQKSLTGTHLTYRQFYENLPVFDEHLKVSVNKQLQVTNVTHDVEPVPPGRDVTPQGSADEAIKAALAAVKTAANADISPTEPPTAEAGIVMSKQDGPVTVYRVTFITKNPIASWVVMVEAENNNVLSVRNVARYVNGRGKVFTPNPIIWSGIANLTDRDNTDFSPLNGHIIEVELHDLDSSGTLSGTFANTKPTNKFTRASSSNSSFMFPRSDNRFEETMVYHWVTETTRYLHSLGFSDAMNFSLGIDVNGTTDDNSAYLSNKTLIFGTGGVDDAEDASIILHEYGHALQDNQVPGISPDNRSEAGAIGEGFGDYWAASFFAGTGGKKGAWNAFVGTWDAADGNSDPPFLRRVDGTKHYPEDLDPTMEEHNNGEIWSAVLWDVWNALKDKKLSDTLIVEAHYRLSPNTTFKENANAILAVDRELNGGKNEVVLRQVFVKRGILASGGSTLTTTPALTGSSWKGSDTAGLKYDYQFKDGGTAAVIITLPDGDKVSDEAAQYSISGNSVKVSIFGGVVVQDGMMSGNQITGRSVLTVDEEKAKLLAKLLKLMKKMSKAKDGKPFEWTANKNAVEMPAPATLAASRWEGNDSSSLKYKYEFQSGGAVSATVLFPSGKSFTDEKAQYNLEGSVVTITMFDRLIKQEGTLSGNSITGKSTFTIGESKSGKTKKLRAELKKMSKSKSGVGTIDDWSAVRIN